MPLWDHLRRRGAASPIAADAPRWVRLAYVEFARVAGRSLDTVNDRLRAKVLVVACDADPAGEDEVSRAVREFVVGLGFH